jgi:hypothetical protein
MSGTDRDICRFQPRSRICMRSGEVEIRGGTGLSRNERSVVIPEGADLVRPEFGAEMQ